MIGRALRVMRVLNDFTGKDMAESLGICTTYLYDIENGKENPSTELLQKYADAFEVKLSTIMAFKKRIDSGNLLGSKFMNTVLALMEFVAEGKNIK